VSAGEAPAWPPIRCPVCGSVTAPSERAYACSCGWQQTCGPGVVVWDAAPPADAAYPAHAARSQAEWEVRHFWPRGRARILGDLLRRWVRPGEPGRPARFLEVGCGGGTILAEALASGMQTTGCDAFVSNLEVARERAPGATLFRVEGAAVAAPGWFDAAGLFDVIEHVDDERPLLTGCHRAVRPGGLLLVTVPAFAWLYGRRDRIAGHRRRYRGRQLRRRLEESGWTVEWLSYFSTVLFPLFAAARLSERLSAPHREEPASGTDFAEAKAGPILNRTGLLAFDLERWWLRRRRLPFGTSLAVVARRP
jgi:SAM-dependent methyltransferase